MKSRKLTENLPWNIILTRISLQGQRRGSRRLVRPMTCCLMLRRSRFMISMARMGSRGVWGVDHRLEGCPTLEMVQDSATLTMETPGLHFHSSLEGAILLLHSSQPIQEVWVELKGWILILRSLLEELDPEEECLQEDSLEDPEVSTMEEVPANKQRCKIKPLRKKFLSVLRNASRRSVWKTRKFQLWRRSQQT